MRISGGDMIQNVKDFSLVLCCCLFLSLCTACTQPLTGNIETLSPMPTQPEATIPSNSPEALLHEWSGDGFSYTSENLGITVEFPPEWENLMTISDDITYEYFVEGQSEPLNCVTLKAIHGGENGEIPIAYIYWRAADDHGPEADYGECVTLVEREGNVCLCWMPMNTKIGLELLEDTALYDEYDIVEQGILSGEYEIELLDLERDLSELAFDNLDMNAPVGVGFNLAFENDDFIIFYGTDGLFCYDLSEKEIIFSVDFIKVSGTTGAVQGTAGTDVSVSRDGQSMILVYSDMDTPDAVYDAYYISIPTMTYHCGEYHPMEDAFNPENAVGYVLPGAVYSHTRYIRGNSSWDVFDSQ